MHKPEAILIRAHAYGLIISICAISPITPAAAKAANARECPTTPITLGAYQQPIKKPKKWADPSNPISALEKFNAKPDSASKGPKPPVDICNKTTDRKRAANEIINLIKVC
jgi:hypothetical protein